MTAPLPTSSSLYKLLKNIPKLYNKNLGNMFSSVILGNNEKSGFSIKYNSEFLSPTTGIALDSSNNIYTVSTNNLYKYSSSGILLGSYTSVAPNFLDLVIPSNNIIYALSSTDNSVYTFDLNLNLLHIYPVSSSSNLASISFFNSNIFISNSVENKIYVFTLSMLFLEFVAQGVYAGVTLDGIMGTAFDSFGNIYISDTGNSRVVVLNSSYNLKGVISYAPLTEPTYLKVDYLGNIYVMDIGGSNYVYVFDKNFNFVLRFGGFGSSPGLFNSPLGIVIGPANSVYVADSGNNRIEKFIFFVGDSTGIQLPGTIYPQASNVVKLLSASGFVLDNFLNDIQNAKQETYIGDVIVEIQNLPSGGPVAGASLDAIALPGYLFGINQITAGQTITFPFPINVNRQVYIIINNIGTAPFTMYGVTISPGSSQVYNYTYGLNGSIQTWTPVSSVNAVQVPGADYVLPTSTPSGNGVDYLSLVGTGYNTPRTFITDDPTYKLWINQNVTGPKISPIGIQTILNTIFPGLGAKVFDWFPSSYSQMITLLAANPGYLAYSVPSGNSYSVPGEPNYPTSGPPFTFYITIPNIVTPSTPGGVYADWSFFDYGQAIVDLTHYGGFFSDVSQADELPVFINIVQQIKSAGTNPVIILL